MTSLAEFPKSPSGQVGLLFIDSSQGNLRLCDEKIEVTYTVRAVVGLNNH